MTGAFLFGGGFWLILAALVALGCCRMAARGDRQLERARDALARGAQEREAQSHLYSLRSWERRTEYVVPSRPDKWA